LGNLADEGSQELVQLCFALHGARVPGLKWLAGTTAQKCPHKLDGKSGNGGSRTRYRNQQRNGGTQGSGPRWQRPGCSQSFPRWRSRLIWSLRRCLAWRMGLGTSCHSCKRLLVAPRASLADRCTVTYPRLWRRMVIVCLRASPVSAGFLRASRVMGGDRQGLPPNWRLAQGEAR